MNFLLGFLFCILNLTVAENNDSRFLYNLSFPNILDIPPFNIFKPDLGAVVVVAANDTTEDTENRTLIEYDPVSIDNREKVEQYINKYFISEEPILEIETSNTVPKNKSFSSTVPQFIIPRFHLLQNLFSVQKIKSTSTQYTYKTVYETIHPTCIKLVNAFTPCAFVPEVKPTKSYGTDFWKEAFTKMPSNYLTGDGYFDHEKNNVRNLRLTTSEPVTTTRALSMFSEESRVNPLSFRDETEPLPEVVDADSFATPVLPETNSGSKLLSKMHSPSLITPQIESFIHHVTVTHTSSVLDSSTVIVSQNCIPISQRVPTCSPDNQISAIFDDHNTPVVLIPPTSINNLQLFSDLQFRDLMNSSVLRLLSLAQKISSEKQKSQIALQNPSNPEIYYATNEGISTGLH